MRSMGAMQGHLTRYLGCFLIAETIYPQRNLEKGRSVFAHSLSTAPRGREGVAEGPWVGRSYCIHSQESESREHWFSACFSPSFPSETLVHREWCCLHLRLGLPISINLA